MRNLHSQKIAFSFCVADDIVNVIFASLESIIGVYSIIGVEIDNVVDSVSNSGLIHRVKDTVSKVKDYFGKIGSPSGKVDSKVGGTTTSGSHNGSHSFGKF